MQSAQAVVACDEQAASLAMLELSELLGMHEEEMVMAGYDAVCIGCPITQASLHASRDASGLHRVMPQACIG